MTLNIVEPAAEAINKFHIKQWQIETFFINTRTASINYIEEILKSSCWHFRRWKLANLERLRALSQLEISIKLKVSFVIFSLALCCCLRRWLTTLNKTRFERWFECGAYLRVSRLKRSACVELLIVLNFFLRTSLNNNSRLFPVFKWSEDVAMFTRRSLLTKWSETCSCVGEADLALCAEKKKRIRKKIVSESSWRKLAREKQNARNIRSTNFHLINQIVKFVTINFKD